jgi:hypothetical protein
VAVVVRLCEMVAAYVVGRVALAGPDGTGWRRPARAANPSSARRISSLRHNVPT